MVPSTPPLATAYEGFLLDRRARRCTDKTMQHYEYTTGGFVAWLADHSVTDVASITSTHIRTYLVSFQDRGLKDTTVHAHARGIKAFCSWLVAEEYLAQSPMRKVAMPRLENRIPAPFPPEEIKTLLSLCDPRTVMGARNKAILLTLLDTGLRAAEFVSLRVGSVDMQTGLAVVLGKGRKQRQLRVGQKARAAINRMLGYRNETPTTGDPLWMAYDFQGRERGALSLHGLQTTLVRLGRKAGVTPCAPHRFRRTFAIMCLRSGMDLYSLQLLMGHSSLDILQRYLALAGEDIERAHATHSPVDNLF